MTKLCGSCPYRESGDGRSRKHHNFIFAMIDVAFDNWPPKHPFQPIDAEDLRAWLRVEVGHKDEIEVDLTSFADARAIAERATIATVKIARSLFGERKGIRMFRTNSGVRVIAPRSMSKAAIPDSEEWGRLVDKMVGKIEDVLDVPADILKQEAVSRAASKRRIRDGQRARPEGERRPPV